MQNAVNAVCLLYGLVIVLVVVAGIAYGTWRSAQGVHPRAGYRPLGAPIQFPGGRRAYPMWRDPQPAREVE